MISVPNPSWSGFIQVMVGVVASCFVVSAIPHLEVQIHAVEGVIKSAYEPSGPSGWSSTWFP